MPGKNLKYHLRTEIKRKPCVKCLFLMMKQSGGKFSTLSDCNCEGKCPWLLREEIQRLLERVGLVAYRQISALVRSHWLKRQEDATHLSGQREFPQNNLRIPNSTAKVGSSHLILMVTKKLH